MYGDDYNTPDGTGVRDYIHVVDLAKGHVKAIQALQNGLTGASAINLGTGNGISVLEMVNAFSDANKVKIAYKIAPRRPGDTAACYADASKAQKILNWQAELNVSDMVKDSWHWQSKNPNGYN